MLRVPTMWQLGGLASVAIALLLGALTKTKNPLQYQFTIGGWQHAVWVPLLGMWFWIWLRTQSIRKKVKAADGLACRSCLYNLRGLDRTGTCPECGARYEAEEVIQAWKKDFAWDPL